MTIGLQQGGMHFLNGRAAGCPQGRHQLMVGQFLPIEDLGKQPAIVDENFRAPLDECFDGFIFVGQQADHPVHPNQCAGRDHSPTHRVITAIHGILHGIAENQK